MSGKSDKLKEQIEYYLSDENLNSDEFFRKEISNGGEGYVNLNVFQKCNKIKKLGVTNEDILNALSNSDKLEINASKNSIRRKNNTALPEFKETNKKLKTENNNKQEEVKSVELKVEKQPEEPEKYEPLVFAMVSDNQIVDWKIIHAELEKQLGTKIYYTRYNKEDKSGHFVVNKFLIDEEKKQKIETTGMKIDNVEFKIHGVQDKELDYFWKEHGGHYTLCVERHNEGESKTRKKDRKAQKNDRKEREKHSKQLEITLANRKYNDPSKVKNIFKNLLNTTSNGDKIPEPSHTMLKDILKFHENAEQKLEKLDHFTVGIHPDYKNTRCFFAVREDNTQEDFSVQKCLDKIMNKSKLKN